MEIIWSLGLVVMILLALNYMAGGHPSNVLRPVTGLINGVFAVVLRLSMSALGAVVRLLGATVKLPSPKARDDKPYGPTPPRWDK